MASEGFVTPSHVWVGFVADGHPVCQLAVHPSTFTEQDAALVRWCIAFWVKVQAIDINRCGFAPWERSWDHALATRGEWERTEPLEFTAVDVWLPPPAAPPVFLDASKTGEKSDGG